MVAYCTKEDLLTGDIPLAGKYGDGTAFVQLAADEIDGQIGHLYDTPVVFTDINDPRSRPAQLLLKKINTLLASGRIILDMAAGSEDNSLHAYGNSMLREALKLLGMISSGDIELYGAVLIPTEVDNNLNTGPAIVNVDSFSRVEGYYVDQPMPTLGESFPPVRRVGQAYDVSP